MANETHHHLFSSLTMAGGTIVPVLHKLAPTNEDLRSTWKILSGALHPMDLVVLTWFVYVPVPLARMMYHGHTYHHVKDDDDDDSFQKSYLYQFAYHVSVAAKLARIVYAVDCLLVVLVGLGFFSFHEHLGTLSVAFAKVLYISWAATRLSALKRYLLHNYLSSSPEKVGLLHIFDRLLDGLIYVCTAFFLMDILEVEMGIGVSSVLTFGSLGTLMVGLATQNLATMLVAGAAMNTSNHFKEGDVVCFGDGTNGFVGDVGWMETTILGFDNILEVVPNSLLGMQRVKNLSRCQMCQITQLLRFRYDDADKLPKVLDDILSEIKESCPQAITDGSKPFRAVWQNYQKDHLEVLLNTHYHLPPIGNQYWENRQRVMIAIHRAVKKNGVKFVTTLWPKEEE